MSWKQPSCRKNTVLRYTIFWHWTQMPLFSPNSINLTPQKWCPTKMLVNSAACRLLEKRKDSSGLDPASCKGETEAKLLLNWCLNCKHKFHLRQLQRCHPGGWWWGDEKNISVLLLMNSLSFKKTNAIIGEDISHRLLFLASNTRCTQAHGWGVLSPSLMTGTSPLIHWAATDSLAPEVRAWVWKVKTFPRAVAQNARSHPERDRLKNKLIEF